MQSIVQHTSQSVKRHKSDSWSHSVIHTNETFPFLCSPILISVFDKIWSAWIDKSIHREWEKGSYLWYAVQTLHPNCELFNKVWT